MANIVIDSYTLIKNPIEMTLLEKDKFASSILTYTSVAYFSWGTTLIGKVLSLRWGALTIAEYNILQVKYEADTEIVFDPQQGDSKTYNVEMSRFTGGYHMSLLDSADFRKDVEMDLLIISEV